MFVSQSQQLEDEKTAPISGACTSPGSAVADFCAFAPSGTATLYILLATYSRLLMGHWPKYYEYLTVYDSPIFKLLGIAFLFSGALSLISGMVLWGRWRWWQAAVFITSWVLLVALVMADPCGFTSFLID